MALIYLSYTKVTRNNVSLCIVRSETIFEDSALPVLIRNKIMPCKSRPANLKLLELEQILTANKDKIPLSEKITVYCDDETLAAEWNDVLEGRLDTMKNAAIWNKVIQAMAHRKKRPEFKARGLLSPSIRADARKYLVENGKFTEGRNRYDAGRNPGSND